MDTTNMTLRLPPELAKRLEEQAAQKRVSRHQLIIDALQAEYGGAYDPDLVLAWFQADRLADIDSETGPMECGDCEYDIIGMPWFGITGANQIIGPFCDGCADSQ